MIPLYYAYVAFSNLSMVSTVMGLYLEHVGFSLAGVGVLFGALQLGKTLLEVPTGFVADRFGSRASLAAAVALEMAGLRPHARRARPPGDALRHARPRGGLHAHHGLRHGPRGRPPHRARPRGASSPA